jgi:hypothetical protein
VRLVSEFDRYVPYCSLINEICTELKRLLTTIINYTCGTIFFLMAPLLLGMRFFTGKPPWSLIMVAIIFVGWAAWVGFVLSHFQGLWDQIGSGENVSIEDVDRAAADGGPMVGAVFMGWFISILYFLPWFVLFQLMNFIRRLLSGSQQQSTSQIDSTKGPEQMSEIDRGSANRFYNQ